MPRNILQPVEGEDWYVYWCDIIDDAIGWGTEAELVRDFHDNGPEVMTADRFERARKTGTSSFLGWNARGSDLMIGQKGLLPWDRLRDYVERVAAGESTVDLIEPFGDPVTTDEMLAPFEHLENPT